MVVDESWRRLKHEPARRAIPALSTPLRTPFVLRAVLVVAVLSWAGLVFGEPVDTVSFNRDVRPILSDNCFHCHGPDKQRSRLRLDVPDVPLEKGAIVPGNPAGSEMIKRITSDDPEYHMPPPKADRRLNRAQIDTLTRWIAEGAAYERHWAFQPIPPKQEPAVSEDSDGIANAVDAFVLRRLQKEGLAPGEEAGRERLLRRVTLDLTGRPPSLGELDAFLADTAPGAYSRVLDRLLDDPAYGERMALDWLDVARYADTFGYQQDKPNEMWPWRDWVIRAFNENLPYDDFVRWQLAGDLLPAPTQDQRLATAFNRLHRQTNEGGSINEEYLVEYAADRTETFGTAFLGLTIGCARCHDHKFDPISQREYYELFSFFSNIDESGMYSHFTDATPTPTMFLYGETQQQEHRRLREAVASHENDQDHARKEGTAAFQAWLGDFDGKIALPDPVVYLPLNEISKSTTPNLMNDNDPAALSDSPNLVEGYAGMAMHFSGDNAVTIASKINFERADPFTIAFWMKIGEGMERMVVCHHSKASLDAASRGYEILLEDGHVLAGLNHFWPGNAVRVKTIEPLPHDEWVQVSVTYDGSSRAEGLRIYIDGLPAETSVVRDNLYETIRYEGRNSVPLTLGARFRDPGFKDGTLDEFRVFNVCLTGAEIRVLADPEAAIADESDLLAYYLARCDGASRSAGRQLWLNRRVEGAFADALSEIMIMRELDSPASAHRLARGAYDKQREEVFPNTPAAILPYPEDYPRNRLGLADWLLRRDHPLTARVAVNRIWQLFFGRGLVETAEDFGNQGSGPSHPELLDYLAARFIDSGWDVKALCRFIASSATYRQDSTVTDARLERDPDNSLLARGPRKRLSAEEIRDAALYASGLIVAKRGGPSVKPYQPEGLWKESGSTTYSPDSGDSLYRRSLYTFIKRTVPPPMMLTFDATNREVCIVRRSVTTTPLQALVLLNDPQFVEAARVLAQTVLIEHGSDIGARLDDAFRLLTGRAPRRQERDVLLDAYRDQYAQHDSADDEAYTNVGERPVPDGVDRAELAATTAVVQLIMNFEEFQVQL